MTTNFDKLFSLIEDGMLKQFKNDRHYRDHIKTCPRMYNRFMDRLEIEEDLQTICADRGVRLSP